MSRPKGSKNKAKTGIKKVYSLHDITCSADPEKPMGTEGCSCEMYRRAKKAEKEVEELSEQIATLRKEKAQNWANELQKEFTKHNQETQSHNKPYPALQITKERLPQNQKITQEEAEKRLKKRYNQLPGFLKPENGGKEVQKGIEQAKSNSKELSPFLKSRQNAKNGM